jgi:hypothetical protein
MPAASAAIGSWAFSASAGPDDAIRHIGENATVRGMVTSAEFEVNAPCSQRYWTSGNRSHAIFTALMYGNDCSKFGAPRSRFATNESVLTGRISDDRRKPGIVLTDPSQLTQ